MHNANIPTDQELATTAKLVKSTILAALVAGVLLVTVVMPAEYGIDPTGIGKTIGLTKMGEIKTSLAKEAATERAAELEDRPAIEPVPSPAKTITPAPEPTPPVIVLPNHEMHVTLAPNEAAEIKVDMNKGSVVQYTWWTDGGKANFDVHGDSKTLNIRYHGYSKGSQQRKEGEIEAAFDGSHGWFWRNRTADTLNITLQTSGEYTDIKRLE